MLRSSWRRLPIVSSAARSEKPVTFLATCPSALQLESHLHSGCLRVIWRRPRSSDAACPSGLSAE